MRNLVNSRVLSFSAIYLKSNKLNEESLLSPTLQTAENRISQLCPILCSMFKLLQVSCVYNLRPIDMLSPGLGYLAETVLMVNVLCVKSCGSRK